MTTTTLYQDNFSTRLLHFLSRWSLITAFSILMTLAIYASAGSRPSDIVAGREYAELMRAVRSPVSYRFGAGFDVLNFLMVGGTMLIFAGLFARRAPIRAIFIAASGVAQLAGALGDFMRLTGISDLAARFAVAAPNQQTVLLQSFLDLNNVTRAHFGVGALFEVVGFMLVASAAWRLVRFPRWLAVWLAVPGLLGLGLMIPLITGSPVGLFLALDVIGLLSVHVGIAVAFWRPSSLVVSSLENKSAVTI